MASRYDQPDAGTGIDSNIYDERPMDAADDPQDDPLPFAWRDVLSAVATLLGEAVTAETPRRAHELARLGAELISFGESLTNTAYTRESTFNQ